MAADSGDDHVYYNYDPSKVLPVVVAIVFGIATIYHFVSAFRGKTFIIWWPFLVGCCLEVLGYVARESSVHKIDQSDGGQGPYIAQTTLVVVAPAVLAASLYMTFGRIMLWVGEEYSIISPRWVTRTFVSFDVFSFLIQGGGGGILAGAKKGSAFTLGKTIITIGFFIQIISFGTFFILAILYRHRALRAGTPKGAWTTLLSGLYLTVVFIFIRSIYRTTEYLDGNGQNGFFLNHEAFYYCLEAIPILLAVYTMAYFHPSRFGLPARKEDARNATIRGHRQEDEKIFLKDIERAV